MPKTSIKTAAMVAFMSFFVLGCAHSSIASTATTRAPAQSGGGADGSGGGNGFKGKMIESYAKDIRTLPEYTQIVEPILKNLDQKVPMFKRMVLREASAKTWYFIPAKLETLSSNEIGLPIQTDQFALQNKREVFIDFLHYKDIKTLESKAAVLVHEMLMAERLRQIDWYNDSCRAWKKYDQTLDCKGTLSPTDYSQIRGMTSTLMLRAQSMSVQDLTHALLDNDFMTQEYGQGTFARYHGRPPQMILSTAAIADFLESQKSYLPWSMQLPVTDDARKGHGDPELGGSDRGVQCSYNLVRNQSGFLIEIKYEQSPAGGHDPGYSFFSLQTTGEPEYERGEEENVYRIPGRFVETSADFKKACQRFQCWQREKPGKSGAVVIQTLSDLGRTVISMIGIETGDGYLGCRDGSMGTSLNAFKTSSPKHHTQN